MTPSRRAQITFWVAFVLLIAVSAWLRKPGFVQGGFANHDVGGILYNGMLLAAGKMPYVDSIEFKAPGTFYAAWLLADGGRDIAAFQVWANVVALGSLAAVVIGTRALWGSLAGIMAGLVYGAHDLVLDTMDANYVTWAQLPAVASVMVALVGTRRARAGPWFFAAGVLACVALMMKRPAAAAMLTVCIIAVSSGSSALGPTVRARAAARATGWVLMGAGIGALPITLHYVAVGEFEGLWRGFVLNEWGWRYVANGSVIGIDSAPREAAFSAAYFLALPAALAAFTLRGLADPAERRILGLLAIWAAVSIAAAAVGFRFYKGYYLAAAAPLSILAAAPSGLLGVRGPKPWLVRAVALLPALLLLGRQGLLIDAERTNRMHPHDNGGRVVAQRVRQVTEPGDRIWVWGWHLWDVYAFTGHLSSTRFYKTMELTTSENDATWRHPRSPLRFRDDLAAEALMAELRADPPEYIVLGSAVPVREFTELRSFLRARYVRDYAVRLNRVQFWKLRDG